MFYFYFIYIYEPVSVKTGLNDIEMKIHITALRESINFSECFLKIWEDYHYYPLAQQSCGGDIGSVPYVCM